MLAAGFAAGTVLTTAGVASASTTATRQPSCPGGTAIADVPLFVQPGSVRFFLGTPDTLSSGAATFLKPSQNSTTEWLLCALPNGPLLVVNRGMVLTSRSTSPGANVTAETPGNGGTGFSSQQWHFAASVGVIVFTNVKTGLSLRVRNGGPVMGQTVTTGSTSTDWGF
jgi:hypothetical protein